MDRKYLIKELNQLVLLACLQLKNMEEWLKINKHKDINITNKTFKEIYITNSKLHYFLSKKVNPIRNIGISKD